MTNAKFKALRGAPAAFSEIQKQMATVVFGDSAIVEAIHQLVQQTDKAAHRVLLPFNRIEYEPALGEAYVKISGLRAYVATAVSVLSIAIEDQGTIPADLLDFSYVKNPALRTILQRDYRDLLRALGGNFWKAGVILSGGIIEALLAEQLLSDAQRAFSAKAAPKNSHDISTWRFIDLINVAEEIGAVSKGAEKLSHSVREYRNLVHPQKELSSKLKADEQEARIALHVLQIVDRDLRH